MTHLEEVRVEVEQITDALGLPVDEAIKPLVIGLRVCNVITTASCEGHADRALPYPWVDVTELSADQAYSLVARWNNRVAKWRENPGQCWVFVPIGGSPRLVPWDITQPLSALQDNAKEFGLFLQELSQQITTERR